MLAINKVDSVEGSNKLIEKYEKLSKTEKLAKLRKKLLKSENSPNFNDKKNGLSFLTPNTRIVFNYL